MTIDKVTGIMLVTFFYVRDAACFASVSLITCRVLSIIQLSCAFARRFKYGVSLIFGFRWHVHTAVGEF